MKKMAVIMTMLAAGVSAPAVANDNAQANDGLVYFVSGVLDDKGVTNDNKVSQTGKNNRFCWQVSGLTPSSTYQAQENITSPKGGVFSDGRATAKSANDGSQHTLEYLAQSDEQGRYVRCWQFGKSDPVGKYTISVNVGGLQAPVQTFYVAN